MSTTKHTPGPWVIEGQKYEAHRIIDADGNAICQLWYKDETPMDNQDANADRIVSCVNALEDVDDPENFVRTAKVLEKNYDYIVHQRDEAQRKLSLLRLFMIAYTLVALAVAFLYIEPKQVSEAAPFERYRKAYENVKGAETVYMWATDTTDGTDNIIVINPSDDLFPVTFLNGFSE
jgi:hypothetical protein